MTVLMLSLSVRLAPYWQKASVRPSDSSMVSVVLQAAALRVWHRSAAIVRSFIDDRLNFVAMVDVVIEYLLKLMKLFSLPRWRNSMV